MKKQNEQRPKLAPKLRFKGFTNDWEQRELGELSNIRRGASPRPISDPKWFSNESDIGWIRISDVTEQNGRIKNVEQKLSNLGIEKTLILDEGELILSIAASVGKPVINYIKTGIHDGFIVFLNPQFHRDFMFAWLERNQFIWNRYGQPGSQVNINSEIVKKQKVLLPNIKEQEKISNMILKFEDMITLHNLKKEKIEKLKLDLVRRLDFSLTEESDDVFLGDLIEIKSGYGFKSEEFSNNGIPLIRISDIDSGIVKKPDIFIKEDSKHIDFLIKNGDYLIAMSGATTGKVGRYTLSHDAYCNQRIGIIRGIENKIDNNYLEYVLHSSKFQHYISTQWGAGAQPNINLKQIKDYKLRLPKLSEQKLIGSIFANLNSQKDIHKVKVDQLLSLKELYLNKLFI